MIQGPILTNAVCIFVFVSLFVRQRTPKAEVSMGHQCDLVPVAENKFFKVSSLRHYTVVLALSYPSATSMPHLRQTSLYSSPVAPAALNAALARSSTSLGAQSEKAV